MAKKHRSPRMTITVPFELKKQMALVSGVNWSAIAACAFAEKLAAISNGDGVTKPDQRPTRADFDRVMAAIDQFSQRLQKIEKKTDPS